MGDITLPKEKNLTIPNHKSKVIDKAFRIEQIPIYLTKEEIDTLLGSIPESEKRDYLLVYLLWTTGLRISEALNIKKKDIDFYRGGFRKECKEIGE